MWEWQSDRVGLVICHVSHIRDQSCNLANSTCLLSSVSRDSTTKAWALLTQMVFLGGPTSLAIVSTPHTLPPPNKLSGLFRKISLFFVALVLEKVKKARPLQQVATIKPRHVFYTPPPPSPPLPSQPSSL